MVQTKKEQYISTISLILKCFNINKSIPKGYGTRSANYSKYYEMKENLITKIIDNIKKYNLSIKYGIGYDTKDFTLRDGTVVENVSTVVYFEFIHNNHKIQFSFHQYIKCKNFDGVWNGIRNTQLVRNGIDWKNRLFAKNTIKKIY